MSFQRVPVEQTPDVQRWGELRKLHVADAADLEPAFGPRTECIQLSDGAFAADLLQLQAQAITLYSLVSNRGFQLRRWIGWDRLLVAYVNRTEGVLEHGRPWPADHLLIVGAGEVDMSCPGASDTTWIEIDLTRAGQGEHRDLLRLRGAGNVLAAPGKKALYELRAGTAAALRMHGGTETQLLRSIQSAAQSAHASVTGRERDRKDLALVRRVERFMWENLQEPLTLERICGHADCRMRSLIYSFKEWFGLGPIKYLKILRLNGVHRRLRETRGGAPIFEVAADFGFWHMGHFSTDYKHMFGVTASETVCAAREDQTPVPKMHAAVRLADRPAAARNQT